MSSLIFVESGEWFVPEKPERFHSRYNFFPETSQHLPTPPNTKSEFTAQIL